MTFRKDINGLRALAVIAVLLFHLDFNWIPGGFAGVDVFFVISGFLMTGIIVNRLENQSFSLMGFYSDRAKRIFPPLVFVTAFSLILGYFLLLKPTDYANLATHVYSSLGFFSNIIYWLDSGYFDSTPKDKWLLHTWSLSVEWQFYILYPVLVILINRLFPKNGIRITLLILTFFGFIISVFSTLNWPESSYYLLPTRAWEMTFGGLAYFYPLQSEKFNGKIQWIGIILIVSSYLFISKNTPWPGYFALVPILGTYLIISENNKKNFILNSKAFHYIGIWSYSIYLWHWPVIVFASIFNISLNIISQVSMVIISIVLGYFSYSYIEKKININVIFLLFTIVVSTSIFIEQNEVSPIKYSHIKDAVDSIARKPYECFDQEYIQNKTNFTCEISKGTKRILALGDSHMYSSLPVIEKIANKNNIGLEYVGFSGCPPLLDVYPIRSYSEKRNCQRLNKKTFEYSIDNIDIIYLAARWTYYTNGSYSGQGMQYLSLTNRMKNKDKFESINAFTTGLEKTLSEYNKYGKKVILLLQVPMQHRNADKIYFDSTSISGLELEKLSSLSVSYKDHINFQKFVNSKIISISKNFKNVVIVDPTNIYCNLKTCIVGNENESFYFDDDHLSVIGSFKMESYLERIFLENLDIN